MSFPYNELKWLAKNKPTKNKEMTKENDWIKLTKEQQMKLWTALMDLVNLKDYKNEFGKDEFYLKAQPMAWIQAKDIIEEIRN